VDFDRIAQLAPFVSENTLDKLVSKLDGKVDFHMIRKLAPFLSKETIDKLINQKL
jgi:hypothetical protein